MRSFYLLFTVLLSSLALTAQTVDYDAAMSIYHTENSPGAAAIVVKDGKIVYHKAFGMASMELGVPMKKDNVFRIGSITKQFTSAAILKLAEEGKLTLDDELTKFLPDYPTQGKKITVHQLLNHTSGIQSYTDMIAWTEETRRKDFTPEAMVDFFANAPMLSEPGKEWSYNNSGYFLLGMIIEKASGMSYEDYVETQFFEPLGMTSSRYGHPDEITARRAQGYMPTDEGYQNATYLSMTQPYAAGSLLSTVEDLSKWYLAVAAGKVISKESLGKAITPTVLADGSTENYGYGLSIVDIKGSKGYGHGGGINGFLTASTYLPEEKVFVAVFSNCNCNDPGGPANILAQMAIGKYEALVAIEVSEAQLDAYLGQYELSPGFIVTFTREGKQLIGQATGQGAFPLTAIGEHRFANEQAGLEASFNLGKDGKVSSFTLFQGGREMEAKRVE